MSRAEGCGEGGSRRDSSAVAVLLLPDLNSLDIGQGKSYSYTFGRAGEWAYHCSAHYPQGMVGSVLVR